MEGGGNIEFDVDRSDEPHQHLAWATMHSKYPIMT